MMADDGHRRITRGPVPADTPVVTSEPAARRDRPLEPPADVRAGLVRLGRLVGAHVYAGELLPDGRFRETFAGPGLDELLGTRVPHGEAHAAWLAAIHPDDAATVEAMHGALRHGETVEAEYRVVGRDGVVRHVLDRMQPRPAPGGRVLVDGIVLDVSATDEGVPEAEEALYVLELPADGSASLRAVGTGWPRVLGVDVGGDPELVGDAWAAGVHPGDVGGFLAARERLRRGEAVDVAYRLVGLDGQERVVVDRATPHAGAEPGTVLAAGLVFDVTAERRARAELVETRERLETVLAAVEELVFTEQVLDDGSAHGVFLGPGVAGVLGGPVSREDLPACWDAAVHPDDRPAWSRHRAAVVAGRSADVELRLTGLDGRTRWVALRSRPRHDAAGRLLVDGIAADVTERREATERSAERERRLRSLVDAIDDVVLTVELTPPAALSPVLVGRGLERLLGGPVPPRAEPLEIWRAALHPEDRGAFAAALAELAELRPIDHVHRVVGLDGTVRSLEWHARPTPLEGGRVLVEGMLSDVSDHHQALHAVARAHADAEERSRVDVLTGLANRLRLEEAVEAAPPTFALVGLDVDHFKRVNDTYGHAVGDEVLVEVARRLQAAVRASDLVARQGGEEFAVLLPHVPDDEALTRIGESLRRAVERPAFETAAGLLDVTASFGAARRTPADEGPRAAVAEAADAALYAAKRRGRNRVVLASALTAEDLVAEEPAPIRLARALALAAGAAGEGAGAAEAAAAVAEEEGLGAADALSARAAAWLVGVDPAAARAVRELADLAPALEAWRAGDAGPDAPPVVRVLARVALRPAA
jgi:diguanylate cyclase (GGDEF)-like protein